jgi:hypothetical protein
MIMLTTANTFIQPEYLNNRIALKKISEDFNVKIT